MVASSILAVHCHFSPWLLGSGCSAQAGASSQSPRGIGGAFQQRLRNGVRANAFSFPCQVRILRMFAQLKDSAVAGSAVTMNHRPQWIAARTICVDCCLCVLRSGKDLSAALALLDW
jgi:hypothetical protein